MAKFSRKMLFDLRQDEEATKPKVDPDPAVTPLIGCAFSSRRQPATARAARPGWFGEIELYELICIELPPSVRAEFQPGNRSTCCLLNGYDLSVEWQGRILPVHSVHGLRLYAVCFVEDRPNRRGCARRLLRRAQLLVRLDGTNADPVRVTGLDSLSIRTYERASRPKRWPANRHRRRRPRGGTAWLSVLGGRAAAPPAAISSANRPPDACRPCHVEPPRRTPAD